MAIPSDGDGLEFTKVKNCLRDKDGLPIDRVQNNPILDTIMYEVEYKYGQKDSLLSNAIEESKFPQVDGEVNRHVLFQDIFDYMYNCTELKEQDEFIMSRTVTKRCRDTTKGVKFLAQWKYGSTT